MSKKPVDAVLDSVPWKKCEQPPDDGSGLPYPTHEGVLEIAGHKLRCYQLSNGIRIIDADDFEAFFGVKKP